MNIAAFGASGFLGYDFVKCALLSPQIKLQIYSTSPQGLTNLKRHNLRLNHVSVGQFPELDLGEADMVVSFAHPFRIRDGIGPQEQIQLFSQCIQRNHRRRPLKVIQLSSMAVFEPFRQNHFFSESEPTAQAGDSYADQKIMLESLLLATGAPTILLRPTIVYGPYGVDFTDLFLNGFAAGSVFYHNLQGKMQPIFVRDVSTLVLRMIQDFEPGVFHAAGPEAMSWFDYLKRHEVIVNGGKLIHRPGTRTVSSQAGYSRRFKDAILAILRLAEVRDLIHPAVNLFPNFLRKKLKSKVDNPPVLERRPSCDDAPKPIGLNFHEGLRLRLKNKLATDYFSQDRLVSQGKTLERYAGTCATHMDSVMECLHRYFLFRFTDQNPPGSDSSALS